MKKTILVADDDADIVRLISDNLVMEQFHVLKAYSGKEALAQAASTEIDLLLLDIMMPEMDGLEVCRRIRANKNIPIILISARDRELDKIIGLEIGADDYVTKPFSVMELVARVKAHFRKVERLEEEICIRRSATESKRANRPLVLNENTFEALLDGKKLDLSTKEFQLLHFLSENPNIVFSREQIYDRVWGHDFGDMNTVTVYIKNLRKKLAPKSFIVTIWGIGYKFVNEADGA
ncbi:response regulator transcription factor [Paenibacillus sp. y28]|uniref:response regulator transcription factor n=1 Tax=Paenibacillus sp. y28 TaxID=3129110 RepID=UPI003017FCFF